MAERAHVQNAMRSAARGRVLISTGIANRMLDFFRSDAHAARPARPFPELTDREFEILERFADGDNNEDVARELSLSAKTVANNLSRIYT